MSLLVGVSTPAGSALSADSRLCLAVPTIPEGSVVPEFAVTSTGGTTPFHDDTDKLSVVNGAFLLGLVGNTSAHKPPAEIFARIAADRGAVAAERDAEAFMTALAAAGQRHGDEAAILVAYCDPFGEGRLSVVRWPDGQRRELDVHPGTRLRAHAVVPIGVPPAHAVVQRLVDPQRTPLRNFSLAQAANLSRLLVRTAIDMQYFEAGPRHVGGQVLTGVVDHTGARIVHGRTFAVREYGEEAVHDGNR